ncbi:oligosaccharide flippase family protein [Fervidobacterium sp.]
MKRHIRMFLRFSVGIWIRGIVSFISTPIITYLISPEEFGKSSMFSVAFGIVSSLSSLSLEHSLLRFYREYEKEETNKLLWGCLIPGLFFTTIFSLLFLLFGDNLGILLYGENNGLVTVVFLLTLYASLFQRFNQFIVLASGNGVLYSFIEVVNAIVTTASIIVFSVIFKGKFYSIVFGNLLGIFSALITGTLNTSISWKPIKVERRDIRKLMLYALPLVPTQIVHWLFTSIDRISLRQFDTLSEIGLYSVAFKIIGIINLVQTGFSTYWISLAYERYYNDPNQEDFFGKAHDMSSFIMTTFALVVLLFKDFIFFILDKSYRESSSIAPFLVFMPIMFAISETTVVGINFAKKTYLHVVISSVCAVANFFGNCLLVPLYGAKGAALSTGMSYVLYYFMRTIVAEHVYPVRFEKKRITFSIMVLTLVAFCGTFSQSFIRNLLIASLGLVLNTIIYKNEFRKIITNVIRTE